MAETGNGDQRQPPSFGPPAEAQKEQALNCPRCDSTNTKFCYYINYNQTLLSSKGKRARYFCKTCRRYWTKGGSLRNIPVDGDGQQQPPSFDPPAEARLRDSSSGRDTLVGLNSSNSAMVEPGDGRQCQPPLFDLTDSNYGTGDFWRGCFNSPYTATTEPIDWQFLASPFEPPAAAHLPDRNSGGDFWMGCFNSPYTATTEPIDWQRLASPFEPPAAAHLPDSNSGGDFWMGCFNSPNTAITELIDWQCLTSPFEPPAAAHLPDSNSGRGILTGHFPMAEPRDGQQRQAPPFEPPATAHLPVRNSGNGIWIDAQQRQAPLFEPPDLSCRLPAAFARRRFGFTSNIRSRPVGGKKGERTEEEKKEAHRMACRRSRRKIKAQNELMRDQYQKQIEMLRSYELVNKYKHTAELFASQNHEQNLQADTVNSTDLTASGPGTENLEVGNQINELVNQIDRINATVRRRELVLERLRNVATKRQQLAQFPGEMHNILGTVGGSISRLAEEGETMNVEDLERQIQEVEDSFRQRLQEMRNKYFDHDKDSSHTSMFSFEHFQDFIEKSRVDFLEFEGLAQEFETSWKFNLPVPSFLPTHENQLKDYGHITDEDGCQSTLLITDSYILLCSVIKQMNQLQLEQLNLSIIILWRDAINSGLDWSFDEHLRKIANAYFRFYFKRKE